MCVFNYPLFHLNREPERVNAKGNNRQQEPFDIIAEKLSAFSVKNHLTSVDRRVFRVPRFFQANRPRRADSERERANKRLQNTDTDHT